LPWLGAQPEGTAQGSAHPPLGTLGAARRPGQCEELTCQVSLLGPRAHLTAPVIGNLAGLIGMHVICLPSSRWEWHCTPDGTVRLRADLADWTAIAQFSVARAS